MSLRGIPGGGNHVTKYGTTDMYCVLHGDKWLTGGDTGTFLVVEARTQQKKMTLEKLELGQNMQLGFWGHMEVIAFIQQT